MDIERTPSDRFLLIDQAQAEAVAWAGHDDRNTLWMHRMGRISLTAEDASSLEQSATDREVAAQDDWAPSPEAVSKSLATWLELDSLTSDLSMLEPTSDPTRTVSKPFDRQDIAGFIERQTTSAFDLWDGKHSPFNDIEIRRFNDKYSFEPIITVSRIERVTEFSDSAVPFDNGPGQDKRVVYTFTKYGCVASSQTVIIHIVPNGGRFRNKRHTTEARPQEALHGAHQVRDQNISRLFEQLKQLRPREGRVWPAVS